MRAPDRIELRGCVQARLVRLDDPHQPVSVEVAVLGQPVVVARDRGNAPGVPDRDPPRPRQRRGWMLVVIGASGAVVL